MKLPGFIPIDKLLSGLPQLTAPPSVAATHQPPITSWGRGRNITDILRFIWFMIKVDPRIQVACLPNPPADPIAARVDLDPERTMIVKFASKEASIPSDLKTRLQQCMTSRLPFAITC